MSKGEAEMIFV